MDCSLPKRFRIRSFPRGVFRVKLKTVLNCDRSLKPREGLNYPKLLHSSFLTSRDLSQPRLSSDSLVSWEFIKLMKAMEYSLIYGIISQALPVLSIECPSRPAVFSSSDLVLGREQVLWSRAPLNPHLSSTAQNVHPYASWITCRPRILQAGMSSCGSGL